MWTFTMLGAPCARDQILPLVPAGSRMPVFHECVRAPLHAPPVGALIVPADAPEAPAYRVVGYAWLPGPRACRAPLLRARRAGSLGRQETFEIRKEGWSVAVITLSDKGAAGERVDEAGPLAGRMLADALKPQWEQQFLLPDNAHLLRGLLAELALEQQYDLIVTSGGTGIAPTDRTPEATEPLLDMRLDGIVQAMLAASLAKTSRAMISRALAGVIGRCIVVNLPGSPKAVKENLAPILPALDHALRKLNGDAADCGSDA